MAQEFRLPQPTPHDGILEIIGHLGAALIQQRADHDPIIMDHVRTAHELAVKLRRANLVRERRSARGN